MQKVASKNKRAERKERINARKKIGMPPPLPPKKKSEKKVEILAYTHFQIKKNVHCCS